MLKLLVAAILLLCVGCGPTAQERYATALAIRDKEKAAMNEAEKGLQNAEDLARTQVYMKMFGHSPLIKWPEMRRLEANPSAPEALSDADYSDYVDEFGNETKLESKLRDPNSYEKHYYDRELHSFISYRKYVEQKARLERAQKMVANAEAKLSK